MSDQFLPAGSVPTTDETLGDTGFDRPVRAPLRRLVLASTVLAQLAAVTAGVIPALVGLAVCAGLPAGAAVSTRITHRQAQVARNAANITSLIIVAVLTTRLVTTGVSGLRDNLGMMLSLVAMVHSLTWRTRGDTRVALVGAAGMLALAASYAPDILVGLPLLAGIGTLTAAVTRYVRQGQTDLTDPTLTNPTPLGSLQQVQPLNSRAWQAAALVLSLSLLGFLVLPADDGVLRRQLAASIPSSQAGSRASGPTVYTSSRLDLRIRGELSDRAVLEVPSESPSLWRSAVFTRYDGTTFTESRAYQRDPGTDPWTIGPGPAVGNGTVRFLAQAGGTLWTPANPVTLSAPGAQALTETKDGAYRLLGSPVDSYLTSWAAPTLPELVPAGALSPTLSPRWLALPETVPPRVRRLALKLTIKRPRAAAVQAIERWLATNTTYRLDSPVPQPGEDAVDRFLFTDKTGFCEQYAAAETVLLRAAGIPARVVTGLAYGTDIGGGRRVYTEKDLHAWVEVWYPHTGWVISDPTAGATLAPGSLGSGLRAEIATRVTAFLRHVVALPGGRSKTAGILLAVVVFVLLTRRLRARTRRSRAAAHPTVPFAFSGKTGPVAGRPALSGFLAWDARRGPDRRGDSETLAQVAARTPVAADALTVVEQESYGLVPPQEAGQAGEFLTRLDPDPA